MPTELEAKAAAWDAMSAALDDNASGESHSSAADTCAVGFALQRSLAEQASEGFDRPCGCDEGSGPCRYCWDYAESLIGKTIRDREGREWKVTHVDERDSQMTLGGSPEAPYWCNAYDVESGEAVIIDG